MNSITDLGADAAQSSQGNGSNGDYESDYDRYDLNGVSFGMQHPTTAVRGRAVALRKLWDEDDPDRSDVAVIMDDPAVVTSEGPLTGTRVATSDDESDQFKVVNLEDEATSVLGPGGKTENLVVEDDGTIVDDDSGEELDPDELMGIDFSGNTYYGDVGTDFGAHDHIALKRGGGAGRSIASTLDANGATSARSEIERDDDGQITDITLDDDGFPAHNRGYVEYHPDGRDGERPRQSRDPELRPDVEGNEIVIMIQRLRDVDPDYSGNAYWATVFAQLDDDRMAELAEQYAGESDGKEADDFVAELDGESFLKLQPTDEFEPSDALVEDTGWISWNGFDRTDQSDVVALNQARLDADFDRVYVPEGMTIAEATPDSVDANDVLTDTDEADDGDLVAFGGGITESDEQEATA